MMQKYCKMFIAILLSMTLYACQQTDTTVFVERDGQLYEVGDQASFYYPKEFEVVVPAERKDIIQFKRDQEVISYQTIIDDTDNKLSDFPELYVGQLEEDGAKEVGYKNLKINSGLACQEFTGFFQTTGMKFKHLVYFTTEASYVLSYQAPESVYDDNISTISQYLNSLKVHKEEGLKE